MRTLISSVVFSVAFFVAFAAHAGPKVFSLDPSKDGCAANVRDVAASTKIERTLFTTKTCPRDVVFDVPGKRVLVQERGVLRSFAMGAAAAAAEPVKLPAADALVWIDESGKVRAAWIVSAGVDVKEAKGKPTIVTFEGKSYSVGGAEPNAAVWPSWGTPGVAILAELDAGKWKRLEIAPTKFEAGDTPGLDALKTPRKQKTGVITLGELAGAMACVGGVLRCGDEPPKGAAERIKKLGARGVDGVAALTIAGTHALAFALGQGDTVHAFTPIILCADGAVACANSTVLEQPKAGEQGRQLGLAVRDGYALIAEEYTSANAKLIDATGKVLLALPSSTGVVFLPTGLVLGP